MNSNKQHNYKEIIHRLAQVVPHLTGNDLPAGAIIVSKGENSNFTFRRVNEHEILFEAGLGGPSGVNEQVRQKIQELGLENQRFFYQIGHKDEFVEATQRLVG